MKTVAFIFKKIDHNMPQLDWAIEEYIQPYVHHILLIFIKPSKFYILNDPKSMLFLQKNIEFEKDLEKKKIKKFFEKVKFNIREHFDESVEISKIVVENHREKKIKAFVSALDVRTVIMGPDTRIEWWKRIFVSSIDDVLINQGGISVVRIGLKMELD